MGYLDASYNSEANSQVWFYMMGLACCPKSHLIGEMNVHESRPRFQKQVIKKYFEV